MALFGIAVASAGTASAAPLFNEPGAVPTPGVDQNVSGAAGDFNGDGIDDFAISGNTAPDGFVSVMISKGDGTFEATVSYPVPNVQWTRGVSTGDLDGDGDLDLVVGTDAATEVYVLLGEGDGTFASAVVYPAGVYPVGTSIGDMDGDGIPDLVLANASAAEVAVLIGNGDGSFAAPTVFPASSGGPGRANPTLGDFNGDELLDVAVGDLNNSQVIVYLNDPAAPGTLPLATSFGMPAASAYAVDSGDLNDDGRIDLVVSSYGGFGTGGSVSVFMGTGTGTFLPAVEYSSGSTFLLSDVKIADVNDDGIPDLNALGGTGGFPPNGAVAIMIGNGDGSFRFPKQYPIAALFPSGTMALGDFDGNDTLDMAAGSVAASFVGVIRHTNPVATLSAAPAFPDQVESTIGPMQSVTVENTGDVPLDVTAAYLTEDDGSFLIADNPCLAGGVEPDSSCEIGIRFAPASAGAKSATLVVKSNSSEAAELPLTANGVAAPDPVDPLSMRAKLGRLSASPKTRKVKRGKKASFKVRVSNQSDDYPAYGTLVCVSAPRKLIPLGNYCRNLGKLKPGQTKRAKFKLKVTRKAKAGKAYKLRFRAGANNANLRSVKAKVKVKR